MAVLAPSSKLMMKPAEFRLLINEFQGQQFEFGVNEEQSSICSFDSRAASDGRLRALQSSTRAATI